MTYEELRNSIVNSPSRRIFNFRQLNAFETGRRLAEQDMVQYLRDYDGHVPNPLPHIDVDLAVNHGSRHWVQLHTAIQRTRRYTAPRRPEPRPEPITFETFEANTNFDINLNTTNIAFEEVT